ncbi:DUF58 domain-containing protein [Nocardiopsis coralliicola]
MAITGRAVLAAFAAAAVVLASGALGTWAFAAAAVGAVLLLIAADLLLAPSARGIVLERSGEDSVRLGEEAPVELIAAAPSGRRLRGLVRDAWAPSSGAEPARHRIDVPAGDRVRLTTVLHPQRRGDHASAGVTVRLIGPLGLAARQAVHSAPWTVRVLPPFHSRRHLPDKLARLRELDGRQSALVRGQGSEFDSLREYVSGDDVRSIDWRATARRDTVVVRTWRPERDRRLLVVLDTGRTSAGRVGDTPRLDHSMDAALLLAALAAKAGDRVDLLAYDRAVRAQVRTGGRATTLPPIVEALAPLEPSLVESDPAGMVAAVLGGRDRSRKLVVLLTDLNATALEEGLLPRLSALTSRHLVLVAAVRDPSVESMAAERHDARSVYRAAAAERSLSDRHRITAELRRRGVEVVDATPEHIAPALADAYIALKAQGRL